ncbi:prepilin peptidase [Aeoliella mucimassa]|uniref:prepilin peptidase n=1 Tax=Aeoliella mucimassa TaxID=2527972 RepID=UPI0018D2E07C|nr:A24 family peptidase [Aeoliella mucimassa]
MLVIPLEVRLVLVFCLAAIAASLANGMIYHFAWFTRLRSPWQPRAEGIAPRRRIDFLPILGWWHLRRESVVHGRGHWVRPLAIELCFAIGIAWLYWWETETFGLFTSQLALGTDRANLIGPAHWQFLAHAMLCWFMLIATFIDIDDRIIPDIVTVPGTLLGLLLATLVPLSLLPQVTNPIAIPVAGEQLFNNAGAPTGEYLEPVHLAAASEWPMSLAPDANSLALALGCFWLWCFAFVRRRWITRKGRFKALQFFIVRMVRDWCRRPLRDVTLLGTLAIVGVWWWGGPAWVGLLTSLVGLVGSGGVVWLIRIFAGVALRKEAMGFGDVLLMMMVGTLVGWQAGILIFFMAPFAALVFALVQFITRGENEIPYGPYLCSATVIAIVRWDAIWAQARIFFDRPWFIVATLLVCLVMCGAVLAIWQAIKDAIWPIDSAS